MPYALLLTIAVLGSAAIPVSAQAEEPERASPEPTKAYATPSAPKSVEIGDFYFKRKKYNAALSRYKEAIKTDAYYPPAYLGLGRVYEKIGLKMKALEAFRKYLDTLPSTKQAEDAKSVQRTISRLERQLKISDSETNARPSRADAPLHSHRD